MATLKDLANLIYPNIHWTLEDLEKRFPKKKFARGSQSYKRFAPSPTGFFTYREFICFFSRILFCSTK